jgi:hypothetical protein
MTLWPQSVQGHNWDIVMTYDPMTSSFTSSVVIKASSSKLNTASVSISVKGWNLALIDWKIKHSVRLLHTYFIFLFIINYILWMISKCPDEGFISRIK